MGETTVRVGQRWTDRDGDFSARIVTGWKPCPYNHCDKHVAFGVDNGICELSLTDGTTWRLISDSPAEVKPAERDWTPWMPPKRLPTTEGVRGVPGQVWAFRGSYDDGTVFRLTSGGNVVLASRMHCYRVGEVCALTAEGGCTVLIQDVNEAEPRDPRVLYGDPFSGIDRTVAPPIEPVVPTFDSAFRALVEIEAARAYSIVGIDYGVPDQAAIWRPGDVPPPRLPLGLNSDYTPGWYADVAPRATCGAILGYGTCELTAGHREGLCRVLPRAPVVTEVRQCQTKNCRTPFQGTALRYCTDLDENGRRAGASLEYSCEPCYLLDEAEFRAPPSESAKPECTPAYESINAGLQVAIWRTR
jgi:hypothetical protein